jgi:YegS/Rv2252/BmrU family lipid kinase
MSLTEKAKLWVILNPVAGKGKALKLYPRIDSFLKAKEANYEIILTKSVGNALDIVRGLPLASGDITVAAGGDGTCNEVVNGLLTRKQDRPESTPLFGVLPIGRGNDFSSSPGIPQKPEKALEMLLSGKERPLDAGFVQGGFFPEGRYFINGVGIGFDTKVGFEAAKLKHVHSGFSYAIGAILSIVRYEQSPLLRIRYGDKEDTMRAVIVSIMNGRRMGGSFYMGPKAILDDGELDICFIRHPPTRRKLIKIVLHYPKGTQEQCEGVFMGRASSFIIEAIEGGMAAHCDGETVCYDGKKLELKCIPGALRLAGC